MNARLKLLVYVSREGLSIAIGKHIQIDLKILLPVFQNEFPLKIVLLDFILTLMKYL